MSNRFFALGAAAVTLTLSLTALVGPASADEPTTPSPRPPCGGAAPMDRNAPGSLPATKSAYFSFPNTNGSDQTAIRTPVLDAINSTNGRYCVQDGFEEDGTTPRYVVRHGVVKIATWSFNDWDIANALIAADRRGVSVQAIAARAINENMRYQPWIGPEGARSTLGYHRDVVPAELLDDEHSWAHDCAGACRGPGGTAHSKYFLFDDFRSATAGEHAGHLVIQSSANLTAFAYKGQWNQANVMYDAQTYADFVENFYEAAQETRRGYVRYERGDVSNIFFPRSGGPDPFMQLLDAASCAGGTSIRVVNYAFYGQRGVALARKLRALSRSGCNVRVIYAISGRTVLRVLRARGSGRIPVKQSVIRNRRGQVVKYNHSKWLTVGDRVLTGSGNWSDSSFNDDEQFQEFTGAGAFRAAFDKTWNQSSSRSVRGGRTGAGFRQMPEEPQWGRGELTYLTPEG